MTSKEHPFGEALDEMDVAAFFNMRKWLQDSVEANGAKMIGGGIGLGQADIDVELNGARFNISIKPLLMPTKADIGDRNESRKPHYVPR